MVCLCTHLAKAQSPPVLMVNKTNCTIEVLANCGYCEDLIPYIQSESDIFEIAPHDVLLYSWAGGNGNGCEGQFVSFKITIPGVPAPQSYPGSFVGVQECSFDNGDCTSQAYEGPIYQNDHPCLGADARIIGEYHPMGITGSTCHIVITEE